MGPPRSVTELKECLTGQTSSHGGLFSLFLHSTKAPEHSLDLCLGKEVVQRLFPDLCL